MEIELVSGWEAVSPENLINEVDSGVQRVEEEEEGARVVLYFDQMTKGENNCIRIEVKQTTKIENVKPALITIYDYYTREETVSISYEL